MSKRTLKGIFQEAYSALAVKAEGDMLEAFPDRYRYPDKFLAAVRVFIECQYHKDAGFKSLDEYATSLKSTLRADEWLGWETLAALPYLEANIVRLIQRGVLKLEMLAPLHGVLNEKNWRNWLFLALYLTDHDLRMAVASWRRMAKTGHNGPTVFVPLWIPVKDYKEIFDVPGSRDPYYTRLKHALDRLVPPSSDG
jgi:hypothetical protein